MQRSNVALQRRDNTSHDTANGTRPLSISNLRCTRHSCGSYLQFSKLNQQALEWRSVGRLLVFHCRNSCSQVLHLYPQLFDHNVLLHQVQLQFICVRKHRKYNRITAHSRLTPTHRLEHTMGGCSGRFVVFVSTLVSMGLRYLPLRSAHCAHHYVNEISFTKWITQHEEGLVANVFPVLSSLPLNLARVKKRSRSKFLQNFTTYKYSTLERSPKPFPLKLNPSRCTATLRLACTLTFLPLNNHGNSRASGHTALHDQAVESRRRLPQATFSFSLTHAPVETAP